MRRVYQKKCVKQLILLTFYEKLKNLRKLDDFSGSNDFDGKETHVKNNFTVFNCCISMRMGRIYLTTYFFVNSRSGWWEIRRPVYSFSYLNFARKMSYCLKIANSFFPIFLSNSFFQGISSYPKAIESISLPSYELV